jgi:hypothetical protein
MIKRVTVCRHGFSNSIYHLYYILIISKEKSGKERLKNLKIDILGGSMLGFAGGNMWGFAILLASFTSKL